MSFVRADILISLRATDPESQTDSKFAIHLYKTCPRSSYANDEDGRRTQYLYTAAYRFAHAQTFEVIIPDRMSIIKGIVHPKWQILSSFTNCVLFFVLNTK